MFTTASTRIKQGYVAGLLSGLSSLRDMVKEGLLCLSLSQSSRLLKSSFDDDWQRRMAEAPQGAYLAVDFVKVKHGGESMEGVDRQHSHEGLIWGHRYLSSALVFPDGQDPYVLRLDAAPTKRMATDDYPYLTASEAMLSVTGDVLVSGYELEGVLVDAEFTSKLTLRSLKHFPVGIIGRFKTNTNVSYQEQDLKARELAEQFPPGRARYYPRLGCYAKRLKVDLSHVGELDLIIIWQAQGSGWRLSLLVSTIKAGVQDLLKAFKARWGLEVLHRTLKQNFALVKCQCLAFIAQLNHIHWAIDALLATRRCRQDYPSLTWKEAQKLAAQQARSALVTD